MVVITLRIDGGKTFKGLSKKEAESLAKEKRKDGFKVWVMTEESFNRQEKLANKIINEIIKEENESKGRKLES